MLLMWEKSYKGTGFELAGISLEGTVVRNAFEKKI